jgi:hypothetical protein
MHRLEVRRAIVPGDLHQHLRVRPVSRCGVGTRRWAAGAHGATCLLASRMLAEERSQIVDLAVNRYPAIALRAARRADRQWGDMQPRWQ